MDKVKAWLNAFRLRTLPLSVSGVITAGFIALSENKFAWKIALLAISTTLFLQILSNLANDFGDSQNGADNSNRIGPQRMVQSGKISLREMKIMIGVFCTLSLISGISLIIVSNIILFSQSFFVLLTLGLLAMYAALMYTVGKKPYGYYGWGDVSVFLFFGLFSVSGTYYLFAGSINPSIFFPAIATGTFSVGVLNLNNMRDQVNDKAVGKNTLVVKLGINKAKYYHISLLLISLISTIIYLVINRSSFYGYIFLLLIIPIFMHLKRIAINTNPALFDGELKKLALISLAYSILFGVGVNL